MQPDLSTVVIGGIVIALPLAAYTIMVRNDLSRRWERLRALVANVHAARQLRRGVGQDVGRHLGHAQRHEQRVTRFASQRGRGGGTAFKVADNANGWPGLTTTSVTTQGLSLDKQSRDAESAARMTLHAEAETYNALVRNWPTCIVARWFGFRAWRYSGNRR